MFTVERSVGRDILRLVMALIDVAAGIVAVVYPGITAEVLAIVVGIWAIFGGSIELAGSWTDRSGWLAIGNAALEPGREAGPQLGSPLIRGQLSTIVGASRGSRP
jgi:uncharacterized membrane protein HdeD (DUF308 family)